MHCAANLCRSGRDICTRAECGYVLDEHDRAALRLNRAMNARVTAASAEAADTPPVTPESAVQLAKRLLGVALLIAAVAAAWAAAWYFPAWPWLVDKLAF